MIHPQPTSILLLLSESERAPRVNGPEPVIGAPHRSVTLVWLKRAARVLTWRKPRRDSSRPPGIKRAPITPHLAGSGSSTSACDGARLRRHMSDPVAASGTPGQPDSGRTRR